jgi:hypothetical protein
MLLNMLQLKLTDTDSLSQTLIASKSLVPSCAVMSITAHVLSTYCISRYITFTIEMLSLRNLKTNASILDVG